MMSGVKQWLLSVRPLRRCWGLVRCREQESKYRTRLARYANRSGPGRPLPTIARLAAPGSVHTFAIVPLHAWHRALLNDLRELGPLTHFDYEFRSPSSRGFSEWRRQMNEQLLKAFAEAHRQRPVDWVYAYVEGTHVLASTVRAIREQFGVPTVNMSLDDKQSWQGQLIDGQWSGSVGLAAAFDLWWTSARVSEGWVNAEGGHGLYLPEGFDLAGSGDGRIAPYCIPVSFIGAAYGQRLSFVEDLRRRRLPVTTFGRGWSGGSAVTNERMMEVYQTSQVVLGHGGVGYSERILNVKGRDFEVPAVGGAVYLTTFNPDLAGHFNVGTEIRCWHSYDDLVEQVHWLLARPDVCREIALAARQRCLREHRWLHRYQTVLQCLGVLVRPAAVACAAGGMPA